MTICSRTKGYCFPYCFLLFYNLKIPKQGIKMQIFFLNGLWKSLKNGHLPVKLHSSAPPGYQGTVKFGMAVYSFLKAEWGRIST